MADAIISNSGTNEKWLGGYTLNALRSDLLAGLTVAALSLPQSMAYALLAGVDPRFGLYTAIVFTAVAGLFGSSRHLINGPTGAVSLVTFSALAIFEPAARLDASRRYREGHSSEIRSAAGLQSPDTGRRSRQSGRRFFRCMPGAGSLSRTAINYQARAATRFSGLITAAFVAVTVLIFAPLASYVPKALLAGLLMVAAARLFDLERLRYILRGSFYDGLLLISTAFSAVAIDIEFAILIGSAISIAWYVTRASKLKDAELVVTPERVVRTASLRIQRVRGGC
jgi:MFS superfamily sulfate permease-like transporter